jgi:signal transduction histidine kinase
MTPGNGEPPERADVSNGRGGSTRDMGSTLAYLRWVIIGSILVVTLVQPLPGRTGHPIWIFVLVFAAYNLVVDLARQRIAGLRSYRWVAITDLPTAGALYAFDAEPSGPLFVIFFLIVITAAVTLSMFGVLAYTITVLAMVAAIAPTLPLWDSLAVEIRVLGSRLAVLLMVGVGTALLTRRLSLEQQAAESMRSEAARLEELDRLRGTFISSVSHDLRTPLTAARAALGMLDLSAGDRLRADEHGLLRNGRRNIERLSFLIDDLLALNQLDAGALRLDRRQFDLRTVASDAVASLHPLIQEKGQVLELDLAEPLTCEGDPRRLEQVLVNVLANAHRHTPAGTHITASGRLLDGELLISVADTGPGVPAGELERIFERFHRGPAGDNGSGLGLAIARSIVELHGGRIWAESVSGRGTTIRIALPCLSSIPDDGPV